VYRTRADNVVELLSATVNDNVVVGDRVEESLADEASLKCPYSLFIVIPTKLS
jgi:hypothetical protein